jgi:hypothetical protein
VGLFSYGSSTLGSTMGGLMPSTPTPTSIGTIQGSTYTPAPAYSGGSFAMGTPRSGGLAAGAPIYLPKKTTAEPAQAPTGASPTPYSGGSSPAPASGGSYTPRQSSGGGGGGGAFSFDFSNNSQGPTMSPMPMPDFSGLFAGMSSLMDKDQAGDVMQQPISAQKDSMQLQGLRENAAGWRDLAGPGGSNPSLGQRILPDESKKLAALQTARIY